MYITFDYKCPTCGHIDSRMVERAEMDEQFCTECPSWRYGKIMIRLPAGTRTTFRFADRKLK